MINYFAAACLQLLQFWSTFSYTDLLGQFEKTGNLGSGGESCVLRVQDRVSREEFALVLVGRRFDLEYAQRYRGYTQPLIERLCVLQQWNPFQVQIYAYFYLEQPSKKERGGYYFHPPIFNWETGGITYHSKAGDEQGDYVSPVYLMELGLRDYDKARFEVKDLGDKDAYEMMICICCHILSSNEVVHADNKYRNYVIKKASDVYLKGTPLSDYDYWAYDYEGVWIYVPKQTYVLKRIDYEGWSLRETQGFSSFTYTDERCALDKLRDRTGMQKETIEQKFLKTPPEGSRILYIKP